MHTFYLETLPPEGGLVRLDKEEARHARVRRLRAGEAVRLVDGLGGRAEGTALDEDRIEAGARGEEPLPHTELVLLQALLPAEKLDWAIQKAVELGAGHIIVYGAERSLGGDRAGKKEERWARLIREASKQCGRARFPHAVFAGDLESAVGLAGESTRLWVADALGGRPDFAMPPARAGLRVGLIVGPEGGFAPAETAFLQAKGFAHLSIGPWVLRSETVAAAGLALLQYGYGDWPAIKEQKHP
jgi:16S rRNA (uracil1498-N3)-methyltransferase